MLNLDSLLKEAETLIQQKKRKQQRKQRSAFEFEDW